MINLNNSEKVIWKHIGPIAEKSITIPPNSYELGGYVLVYDKNRQTLVYAFNGDNNILYAWEWDGKSWKELSSSFFPFSNEKHFRSGFYDAMYKGVAVWQFYITEAVGIIFGEKGIIIIATKKDIENCNYNEKNVVIIECKGEFPAFSKNCYNKLGIFGYDENRETTVCITDAGVWELNKESIWEKKHIVSDNFFPKKCSGWYDSSTQNGCFYNEEIKSLIIWFIDLDEYKLKFYVWDGLNLKEFDSTNIPELALGQGLGIGFCAHSQYNIVYFNYIKDEVFYLEKDHWERLEKPYNLHLIPEGLIVYNPVTQEMMTGPGKGPGKTNIEKQHLFHLWKKEQWIKQGQTKNKSLLNNTYTWYLNFIDENLYATSLRNDLRTAIWDDNTGWSMLVNGDDAKEEFKGKTTGKYFMIKYFIGKSSFLYAISNCGGIYMFDKEKWSRIALEWTEFKDRISFCVGYDAEKDKILVWGGADNNHKILNDTFVFENGNWSKIKKQSPIPIDVVKQEKNKKDLSLYVDFSIVYDTLLKTFVRFGYENVAVLKGEIWVTYKPKHYKELVSASQRSILHDPLSGETIIINRINKKSIIRFNIDECCIISSYALPDEYINNKLNKLWFEPYFAYNPKTRTVQLHDNDNDTENYTLDLSSVFDYAASLGNRYKIDIN